MAIFNFILAAIVFGMMVWSLCGGGGHWWWGLIVGCNFLVMGICEMVTDNMKKYLIDEDELEEILDSL